MKSKHICLKCGYDQFYTVGTILQEWLVDQNGDFLKVTEDCVEVVEEADDGNIWTRARCGTEATIVK